MQIRQGEFTSADGEECSCIPVSDPEESEACGCRTARERKAVASILDRF
jgi:hypothetical protein